jgi:uncharacterized protein (DUF849 family)
LRHHRVTILEPVALIFDLNQIQPVVFKIQQAVCAAGRHQFTMCNLALLMVGNTRVGLEPATPVEARKIINLKGVEKNRF